MYLDAAKFFSIHPLGETATRPSVRCLGHWPLLLLLAWDGHAASSRLAQRPKQRTLGRVQLRFLG